MSEHDRIYFSGEADTQRTASLPDCHWELCRQFMDRYQNLFSQEQIYALSHIFANTQLLLRGDADQTMQLVLDLVKDQPADVPPEEVGYIEKCCCWEKEAEPEFPQPSPVGEVEAGMDNSTSDVEVIVKVEPEEIAEISWRDCPSPKIAIDSELESNSTVKMNPCPTSEKPKDTVPVAIPDGYSSQVPKKTILADGPVTFESVCKNLVLFDGNFYKSQTYYNRLGCGQLEITVKLDSNRSVTHAAIHVNQLILSQVTAKNSSTALKKAVEQFFRVTKDRCFKVETLPHKNALQRTTNLVQRQTQASSSKDTLVSIDPEHYRKVMLDFQERDDGCHLVFSEEFTNLECNVLQGIANQLKVNCRAYDLPDKSKRFMVLARELPPQKIVHRIVLKQDADLGLQYQVTVPKLKDTDSWGALFTKALKTVLNSAENAEPSGPAYDTQLLSPKVDPPVPSTLNPQQQEPSPKKFFMKKVKTQPEPYAETLANLTVFKPVSTLHSVEDVYRNLVLIGSDFQKTAQEFGELKVGSLLVCSKNIVDGFSAMVHVGKFVLVKICSNTRKEVKRKVQKIFFKRAKMFCYQITKKQSPAAEIHVTKQEDPATNIDHYKRLIKNFWEDSFEQDLVFSAEFTKADREKFHSIAHALNLKSCSDGEEGVNRRLRIMGRRLPALAIVERIVVAKDPKLGALFAVTAPRVGSWQTGEGGS